MTIDEVETRLISIVSDYAGRTVSPVEAIYQDVGINGADFCDPAVDDANSAWPRGRTGAVHERGIGDDKRCARLRR